ncbi:MAG: Asp-tRNA(Asn)/Glu-tRNA(Gln) amidotransferase subunit GatC [Candidatus Azotimanducaceae bacterium]
MERFSICREFLSSDTVTELVDEQLLKDLAILAQLPFEPEQVSSTLSAINEVLELVARLEDAETASVLPLAHPLERQQILREDAVTENIDRNQLSQNAPSFEDGLYFVPKVIE